jgi:hypothetical protein
MHKRTLLVCSSVLLLVLANCGGSETSSGLPPAPAGGTAGPTFDMATANATVSGKIVFEGTAPTPARIQMSADPYCQANSGNGVSEEVIVSDGGLENVIVYVRSGLPQANFATPTQEILIDQKNCHYMPHVLTMQANQPLKIRNSDATLHNIHAWAEKNTPFNEGQAVQNMESIKTFTMEEMPLPIRCDVHKWMGAYVGVFEHPFHTVSKGGGTYSLKLPAGNYEIVAWHEKYGEQTQMVQVTDNEQKVDINFTFKGEGSAAD